MDPTAVPEAGYGLDVYPPMSDAVFYGHMFELYRVAWYLKVPSLTKAILAELEKRLVESALTVFRLQHRPADPVFRKVYDDTMKAVVYAFDNSNQYHAAYKPFRDELYLWIGMCYPVFSRVCDDFYEHLDHAPMLAVTILKANRNITTSHFIHPGPEACCMFCNSRVGHDEASMADHAQPTFGVVADRSGGVKYFCGRSACFRQIRVSRCFNGTHTCVGPLCDCGRWLP